MNQCKYVCFVKTKIKYIFLPKIKLSIFAPPFFLRSSFGAMKNWCTHGSTNLRSPIKIEQFRFFNSKFYIKQKKIVLRSEPS